MPVVRTSRRPPLRLPGHSLIQLEVLELDDNDLRKVVGGAWNPHSELPDRSWQAASSGDLGIVSCYAAGTLIATEDGQVPVESIAPIAKAPRLLRPAGSPARIATGAAGPEAAPIFDIELLSGHRISVSEHHPFPTRSRERVGGVVLILPALSLRVGQELQVLEPRTGGLVWTPITAVKRRQYGGFVYNFCLTAPETPEDHRVVANGIVTGDLFSQLYLVGSIRVDASKRLTRGEPMEQLVQELGLNETMLEEWRMAYESTPQALFGEIRLMRAMMQLTDPGYNAGVRTVRPSEFGVREIR